MRRRPATFAAAAVLLAIASTAVPAEAQAAPSIESIKYVTVFDPPGGGTPVRRETPGPSGGAGLTRLNVDSDPEDDMTANVGLSFDAAELAVTGQLQIARLDFGGLLSSTLSTLPVRVEAVAVLKDRVGNLDVRRHVSLGYDALASTAPGRFTVDLGSCTTPNCKTTPTPCVTPCKGTKTTLGVNVVAPGNSLKLTGELADFAAGGGRKDPTRATLDFSPVPGSSSPLVLTIWGTEKKTSSAADAPVETLTHVSMTGNKEATKASARVCRLPGETYTPKQLGDTACEAAAYTDGAFDSRTVDATIDPLPRDVASGNARLTVSVADNDLGATGGKQTLTYGASHPVDNIHVTDEVVTWSDDGKRRVGHRVYDLVDVPLWATLELLDKSKAAGDDDEIPDQTVTYRAGGQLTSVDVKSTEHVDGELKKREDLRLKTVPKELTVEAEETEREIVIPGAHRPGFDRFTRQSVGLVHATSPIGVIEYSTADGETTAAPPADIGNVYVYTNKPENGSQLVKLRLLGATEGSFEIGRHVHLDPWLSPLTDEPTEEAGMDLLSVTGKLTPTAFRTLAEDGARTFDVRVNDLPGEIKLVLEPERGTIDYEGSAPIDEIEVRASDPNTLFERATSLHVLLEGVPEDVVVRYPSEENSDIDLQVDQGEIELFELTALGAGDAVPGGVIGPEDDGMLLRDLEPGIEDVDESYVMFARARGLRQVRYAKGQFDRDDELDQHIDRKQFALDLTSGRTFVIDLEQTGEEKEYSWDSGFDWNDEDTECTTEVVGKRVERTRAVIVGLPRQTTLGYDKRKSFGKRECMENDEIAFGFKLPKREVTDIRYTAATSAPELDFVLADGSTNLHVNLLTLPTKLRFCKAHGHECLPTIGNGYGTSLGSLSLDANDYFTVNLVDCKKEFTADGSCGSANARINDLRLKQFDFWGDLDGVIDGTNGDTYWNTADYDDGAPTWNGVPWDDGPYTGDSQPFQDAGTGKPARIRADDVDFKFGSGFYARGAHVYWDWIADDEIGDWSPDGTGGVVHCPSGTFWEVKGINVHEDWCTSGAAND